MQAYMRSSMPFLGVPMPLVRKVATQVFAEVPLPGAEAWRALVLDLWRRGEHREERYGALVLAGDRRASAFQTFEALPMYEEMIVTGAWWDYVDEIAGHRLGVLLSRSPAPMREAMRAWSRCDNVWKRRSSILCQLALKGDTDKELLYDCIEPSLGSKEFFLRKAIGWALRQLARTEPEEVLRYVRARKDALSPLSKREALKGMRKGGLVDEIP